MPQDSLARIARTVIACRRCPRLVRYREDVARTKKREFADWTYWGRPVPGFGDPRAALLVVGLAPAAHGANRTGRMFTGDNSGHWLFRALHRHGFATQARSEHRGDGLRVRNVYITAAVRCAPPENRPTPEEMATCAGYLRREMGVLLRVRTVVALGQIAFGQVLALAAHEGAELPRPRPRFAHGAEVRLQGRHGPLDIIASYHPSRQNTQTGRLTETMLDEILHRAHLSVSRSGRRD